MLPLKVLSEIQSIDFRVNELERRIDSEEMFLQSIFANHLTLAASGLIEKSTLEILGEYSNRRGNPQLRNFVQKAVSNNNSLNCEKIEKLLNQFDQAWWIQIGIDTSESQRSAVNSLKTIRDQCAHGRYNGTGFRTVKNYYQEAKGFLTVMANVIL